MKKREIFKIDGNKITRLRRNCPKCGSGVFLAEHKDRLSCGSCGYTEFKGKKEQTEPVEKPPKETKPQQPEAEKPKPVESP